KFQFEPRSRTRGAGRQPVFQPVTQRPLTENEIMNKGTAIVGFLLCFLTGMGLMYGVDHRNGELAISGEPSGGGPGDAADSRAPVSSKDPRWGKAPAPVTIVTISDFQCPFCSRVEPTLKQIKDTYGPDKVRMVWKNEPLPFHNRARPTADAAMTVFGL